MLAVRGSGQRGAIQERFTVWKCKNFRVKLLASIVPWVSGAKDTEPEVRNTVVIFACSQVTWQMWGTVKQWTSQEKVSYPAQLCQGIPYKWKWENERRPFHPAIPTSQSRKTREQMMMERLRSKVVCLAAKSDWAGGSTPPHLRTMKQHSRQ